MRVSTADTRSPYEEFQRQFEKQQQQFNEIIPFMKKEGYMNFDNFGQFYPMYEECASELPYTLEKYGDHLACSDTFGTVIDKIQSIACLLILSQNMDSACMPIVARDIARLKRDGASEDNKHVMDIKYRAIRLKMDPWIRGYEKMADPIQGLRAALNALKMIREATCPVEPDTFKLTPDPEGLYCGFSVKKV